MVWGSIFHDGNSMLGDTGDVGPVPAATMALVLTGILNLDTTAEGVFRANNVFDGFAATGTSSPITLASGVGIVNGRLVYSTANTFVTVSTPTSATRKDRLVLQYNATTNQVRQALIPGAEGGGYPSLTQSASKWETPLYKVEIGTGGAIVLTNEREFVKPRIEVNEDMLADVVKTALIPIDGVYDTTTTTQIHRIGKSGYILVDGSLSRCSANFMPPTDLQGAITIAPIIYTASASGNVYGDFTWESGTEGQAPDTKSGSELNRADALVGGEWHAWYPVTIPAADIVQGQIISVVWDCRADNGLDTLGANRTIAGFQITYTGKGA